MKQWMLILAKISPKLRRIRKEKTLLTKVNYKRTSFPHHQQSRYSKDSQIKLVKARQNKQISTIIKNR